MCFISLNFSPERTGIGPYAARLVQVLQGRGIEVVAVTAKPHYPARALFSGASLEVPGVRGEVVRVSHFSYTGGNLIVRSLSEISFGVAAWRAARGIDFETVIAVSPSLVGSLVSTALLRRVSRRRFKLIVWVQDLYSSATTEINSSSRRVSRLVSAVERRYLNSADHVVVIHDGFRSAIEQQFGIPRSKISTQRNWSRWDTIDTSDSRLKQLREDLGWADKSIVLHAGNIGSKQSIETMVEAARYASTIPSAASLLFVAMGGGNRRKEVQQLARGVDNFAVIEPVSEEDYFPVLRAADILLVSEVGSMVSASLPSKLVSYFNAGRPILVAANRSGLTWAEADKSGVCTHVEPESPLELARAALDIVSSSELRSFCETAGPRYAQSIFSEDAASRVFSDVLSRTR